jgi:hypothetical protein
MDDTDKVIKLLKEYFPAADFGQTNEQGIKATYLNTTLYEKTHDGHCRIYNNDSEVVTYGYLSFVANVLEKLRKWGRTACNDADIQNARDLAALVSASDRRESEVAQLVLPLLDRVNTLETLVRELRDEVSALRMIVQLNEGITPGVYDHPSLDATVMHAFDGDEDEGDSADWESSDV